MVSGINRQERWSGQIRFRMPDADDPPIAGMTEGTFFYNWHLAFASADTKDELYKQLKQKLDELIANGRIIGGNSDPITIEHHVTNIHTRTLEEFNEEVKDSEFSEEKHGENQVQQGNVGESAGTEQEG